MLKTKQKQLVLLGIALIVALAMSPTKARAQITGPVEVNIPFQFHVADSNLPAGKYVISTVDDPALMVLEIRSADGSATVPLASGSRLTAARPAPQQPGTKRDRTLFCRGGHLRKGTMLCATKNLSRGSSFISKDQWK
jgi:hypothetical protein